MSDDGMPRDNRGLRPCAWCGETIRNQPTIGRLREYCGRTCRELAYRERATQRRIAQAVAAATAPESSVDETGRSGAAVRPAESAAALPAQGGGQSGGRPSGRSAGLPEHGFSGGAKDAKHREAAPLAASLAPPGVPCLPSASTGRRDAPRDPAAPPTKRKIVADPLPLWE